MKWKGRTNITIRDKFPEGNGESILNRKRIASLTEKWFKVKGNIFSATNLGPVLTKHDIYGCNPYQSEKSLFIKKTSPMKKMISNIACSHGIKYEPEAMKIYEDVTGIELYHGDIGLLIGPPENSSVYVPSFMGATPDAVAIGKDLLIEIKCPFSRQPEHCVPEYYYPQVQQQMAVTGINTCHFVQFIPPSTFDDGLIDIVEIKFDPVWWCKALDFVVKFWMTVQVHRALVPTWNTDVAVEENVEQKVKKVKKRICHKKELFNTCVFNKIICDYLLYGTEV